MTLRHIVAWKLAAEDSSTRDEHARSMIEQLEALVGVVPPIDSLSVGQGIIEGNWDVALVLDVADAEALQAYQVHPAHEALLPFIRSVVANRVAVDFEV